MSWDADLTGNMVAVQDGEPTVIMTDSSGVEFGTGYPGYLGAGCAAQSVSGLAGRTAALISAGRVNDVPDDDTIRTTDMLRTNSSGWYPNPEYGGVAGRTSRLAFDVTGPATSTSVESFAMTGARIRPGRPDLARGGPVGASGDLGQYLAVAMAQSTYDFPAQDLSQLNVLLGV